jgi:hypothetical protein
MRSVQTPPDGNQVLARSPVSFEGIASVAGAPLRSPVSGQVCVYWRLRIVEHMTASTELVHEVASEESFELRWNGTGEDGRPAVCVRLEPEAARIHATPVLHRPGTPGAVAAAQHFGLHGAVSVEEVLIRPGEALSAEGLISDLDEAVGAGPFRGTARGPELLEAIVTLESKSLGPALLPWALGTAAALLGGMGLTTYAAWRYHLVHLPPGASVRVPRLLIPHAHLEIQPPELPRPRMP